MAKSESSVKVAADRGVSGTRQQHCFSSGTNCSVLSDTCARKMHADPRRSTSACSCCGAVFWNGRGATLCLLAFLEESECASTREVAVS